MFFRWISADKLQLSQQALKWFLPVLLALFGLAGCAVDARSPRLDIKQQIDRQTDGQTSELSAGNAAALQAMASAQVVYLAETHDSEADHIAQLEIIEALAAQNSLAIGLEMFQRPFQAQLDAYLAGTISEAELVSRSEYETRWGFDWELYAPIIRYAKAQQIPLVALNTPAEVTRQVAQTGLLSLEGDALTNIPPTDEIDLSNQAHRDWIREVFDAHGGAGHSLNFENFYAAQVLWDETMAERVVQQVVAQPDRQVIVLAGEGHVAYGYGIPSRVARRIPDIQQVSVQLLPPGVTAEDGFSDYVWETR